MAKHPSLQKVKKRARRAFRLMHSAANHQDGMIDWEFVFAVRQRAIEEVDYANALEEEQKKEKPWH